MPTRRAAGTPPKESAPSTAAEQEPDAVSEEPPSAEEDDDVAPSAKYTGDGEEASDPEPKENGEEADEAAGKKGDEAEGEQLKDGKLQKAKIKKKKTIPAWATIAASKKFPVSNFAGSHPTVDAILVEAVKSSEDRSGISTVSLMKYIMKNYPALELDRKKKKFLLKKALKRQIEKGTIKQLKGKGFSGSFVVGKPIPDKDKPSTSTKKVASSSVKSETLGDALPLIITRLCEPKEASYILIKKYLVQHFPHLRIENRPDLLKSALLRAVERGQLERLTGKGAGGTFQLKRSEGQVLLKGGGLEDAITAAITAMNEPKTCSTTVLRRFLIESNKEANGSRLVGTLRKTLTKCKVLGWMEQITGKGFSGTYRLSFPFYPSPAVLYPDRVIAPPKEKRAKRTYDSSDEEEEEESEEEEDSDDEPPAKRRAVKRGPPKVRKPLPAKNSRGASKSKAKSKVATPAKKTAAASKKKPAAKKAAASPAKKAAASPAKKAAASPVKKSTASAKKAPAKKATPVKKAAPAKKTKTPAVKTLPRRGGKGKPIQYEESEEEEEEEEEVVVKKPAAKKGAAAKTKSVRKSGRGKK